jgi:two-component system LytT family response regulator
MPVRVVVADDEPLARERVVTLAREMPDLEVVGEAAHGMEALDLIAATQPDMVLLDIEMPELDGFGVIAALEMERPPVVVFITSHPEYAARAFEVEAVDFIRKPISPERFSAAIRRAVDRLAYRDDAARAASALATEQVRKQARTRYVVRKGPTHVFVGVNEVDWIDAADNYLRLHAGGKIHFVRGTMKDAEEELTLAGFVRVHRSAIVNASRIVAVDSVPDGGFVVRLSDGSRLRASRQYQGAVRAMLK